MRYAPTGLFYLYQYEGIASPIRLFSFFLLSCLSRFYRHPVTLDLQSSVIELSDLQSETSTNDALQLTMRVMRITNPRLYYGGLQIRRDGILPCHSDDCKEEESHTHVDAYEMLHSVQHDMSRVIVLSLQSRWITNPP